ncbi:integral membrane protease protein [Mycoavidus cysteinexigens]|uniref:Integral membrane protease protein n=1 Tax=Mycoavidus cysteinexigens TaxID=1553431 RepID=A0A2Z6EU73_9BURK|nr:M48 family metallopeptidase [Mycoavidus cysteinexigens]BBE08999.1 integral membrane protease protein [Mycoavidus cysteinexigens]GAM52273.1 macromolecule metabolism [bacterium endosymbiont of Mortierella elongata FMR23-6]GLR01156.1 peptidase [Mycoavidus cysteinexigens]
MLTIFFMLALIAMVSTKLWLATRQIRYVTFHRNAVPVQFASTISLAAHQRAADYTVARTHLANAETVTGAIVLFALTLLGGLQALSTAVSGWFGHGYAGQIALVASVLVLLSLIDLPFDYIRHFSIEQRFGFNRMTKTLFIVDLLKGLALSAVFGLPLLFIVLWLMAQAGRFWWLWAWAVWATFSLLALVIYPTLIAPLFNKFEPLRDETMRSRIEALLKRCGFAARGLFVMDGSRRSAHGNAYFTGFGRAKRIVFFDTLLARLSENEVEAVLAHELGHFKRRHVTQRLAITFAISFGLMALFGWLVQHDWFYSSLGVTPPALTTGNPHGLALILFSLIMPVFLFFLGPLNSLLSRRHEFEADAFAAKQTDAHELVSALVKLYEDNASTLTPDPIYSTFYYSHPPAAQRIEQLLAAA